MTTADGLRNQVKNTQKKEENMNARKAVSVVCVVCVLVVSLLVLESAALAGPPSLDLRLGEMPLYGSNGVPVAPKVSVPLYRAGDSKVPSFLRGVGSAKQAAPRLDPLWHYPLDNNVAPKVKVPQYLWNGPRPHGF
jgi:hypothetical protein